jgi:hypothetical protein
MSFEDALASSSGKPHLLIGNGFSMALDAAAFSYGSLIERADFKALTCDAAALFGELETSDFEIVIERLRATNTIARLYEPSSPIGERATKDAEVLREALAKALAASHPDNVGSITHTQYASVRTFLANFKSVYSLNYDLLLYWATLSDEDDLDVPKGDGFRGDPEDADAPWVTWDMGQSWSQQVHYLHGALHLFDAGDRLKKLTWIRTEIPLVDQIREQLAEGSYPLVVTEGKSSEKMDKILHSAYLSKAFRSFSAIGGDLFVYGLSFGESDAHVLDAMVRGKVERLFVSVYGDPDDPANRVLVERAELLVARRAHYATETKRRSAKTLGVKFFDSATASVWNHDPGN